MMLTKPAQRRVHRFALMFVSSLCIFLQMGCGEYNPSEYSLPSNEVPCSTTEARDQISQYFANQSPAMRVKEETDGKDISITTLPEVEPSKGRREIRATYIVEIKLTENNKSRVSLKWATESKGIHEQGWRTDKDTRYEPKRVEAILQVIKNLCRSGQQ